MGEVFNQWRSYSKETVEILNQVVQQAGVELTPRGCHRGSITPVFEARFYQNNKSQALIDFIEMYPNENNHDGKLYLICWISPPNSPRK